MSSYVIHWAHRWCLRTDFAKRKSAWLIMTTHILSLKSHGWTRQPWPPSQSKTAKTSSLYINFKVWQDLIVSPNFTLLDSSMSCSMSTCAHLFHQGRPPSLEGFFNERLIRSAPGSQVEAPVEGNFWRWNFVTNRSWVQGKDRRGETNSGKERSFLNL